VNPFLLDYLACPVCKGPVETHSIFALVRDEAGKKSIMEGLLRCQRCQRPYPVIDEIPRMLPAESMSDEEREFLRSPPPVRRESPRTALSERERRAKIEEIIMSRYHPSSPASPYWRARIERDADYQTEKTEKKEKVFFTVYPLLRRAPTAVADIGGGQGGLITCLRKFLNPKIAIILDCDLWWIKLARLRDTEVEVIRGDAASLPFRERSIDLMVSMYTLEHIPQWRRALTEMARACQTLFLSYNPNRYCFFDKGHLDAPVFPFLPDEVTCRISHLWHVIRRTGWSYRSILEQYRRTNYISRHRVQAVLDRFGKTINVWNDFIFHSLRSDYHFLAARAKRFLRRHYVVQALFSLVLTSLGVEPNVYLILQRDQRSDRVERGGNERKKQAS